MTRQEIVITFYDGTADKHEPFAIAFSNGYTTFYKLKKMNREDVAALLGADKPEV